MRLCCDLHIHTALSPCADKDMTPGNIIGMAKLKGLDVIAVTDHQRCTNVLPAMSIAKEYGITVIPGMELETSEEIHFICLFPTLDQSLVFESFVKSRMPAIRNREDIFGEELLFDSNDEIIGKEENLLLVSSNISYTEAIDEVEKLGGVLYPAHVDRDSFSILSSFGMIPPEYLSHSLEISTLCDERLFMSAHPELQGYRMIRSSDAHALTAILEPGMMVEIAQFQKDENTISQLLNALHR